MLKTKPLPMLPMLFASSLPRSISPYTVNWGYAREGIFDRAASAGAAK
jgi:hypothetical protein